MISEVEKILNLKIGEINSLKTIIDTLTKIVSETIWTIFNPKDKNKFTGIEITTTDQSKTLFVKIQIDKKNFLDFNCKYEKYEMGVNLEKLNKIIKFVEKDDIINMFLIEKDLQCLLIDIERASTKGKKNLKFPLLDLGIENKTIKKEEYEKIVSTTSSIFKKIFKEYDDFENVKIKCQMKNILFTYKDDTGAEINDEYILDIDGINIENFSTNDDFIGVYPINNLILFGKCANLCENIHIYMKNKNALVIKLITTSFGTITISSSPVNEECIKNTEYEYSDDEDDVELIIKK
jgi:hypothetical protein